MKIKIRILRNWVTTILGSLLMLFAIVLYLLSKLGKFDFEFSFVQLLPVVLLAWVLLMAKDSILEGITMGFFKIKSKGEE
jgi:hypothetical protein